MKNVQDDGYSSCREYELILEDLTNLEDNINKMSESEVVNFYTYVIDRLGMDTDNDDVLWLAVMFLEERNEVRVYKDGKMGLSKEKDSYLTKEDEEDIASIVKTIENKRKVSPIKKILKMIRA